MNKIVKKTQFSEKVYRLEVEAPLIAKARKAGHFVIVRVGEKGERVPLTIADGLENRQILSGIAAEYDPSELIGRQVVFIANLPARTFKVGKEELVSEGMILSAENYDGRLSVVTVDREVLPGSEVG